MCVGNKDALSAGHAKDIHSYPLIFKDKHRISQNHLDRNKHRRMSRVKLPYRAKTWVICTPKIEWTSIKALKEEKEFKS